MASTVPINPEIIIWARKYHDLTQEQLAEKLANALHLSFGYLFLSDIPELETPLPDLRTRV